jgi:hypothetical protein
LAAVTLGAQATPHSEDIDAPERAVLIDKILGKLRDFYVFPDIAQKMAADIGARESSGQYDHLAIGAEFALALTRDLQAVSGDKHLRVEFSSKPLKNVPSSPPAAPLTPLPASNEEDESLQKKWRSENCMFLNVALMAGNVGYLRLDAFRPPRVCGETAAAAMRFVADTNALIIDLRNNSGGDPAMGAFLSSYFFSEPAHLNDLYERSTDVTVQSWTLPFVPGPRYTSKPIFILTSPRTFSAAEEFAYSLQALKRATIVGETSGGGAHAAIRLRIDDHFCVAVPFARSVNPTSKTTWEKKGVEPDLRVPENVAVQAAYRSALTEFASSMPHSEQRVAIEREIASLGKFFEANK